ncbi:poly-gamma-glutamate hydrolase family protein [Thalassobacillus sp. C254]|uniref:poly-gamma-glutamate hydrolase family protein n=1 Tax=Thalassobacillus sp. C254 TaxID=1225341 RepID=UPI0006D28510|nr:poly-gamma-glutamate hydrolase family protein [Thalassobacillus sp. C254]
MKTPFERWDGCQDLYDSMTELLSDPYWSPGRDYSFTIKENDSETVVSSLHGGGIEPGTTEVACLVSEKGGFTYFDFNGRLRKSNTILHVTSNHYDEKNIVRISHEKKHHLAFHGCMGKESVTYIGGLNYSLRNAIWSSLEAYGFQVELAPFHIGGNNPVNVCNRTKIGKGVQFELSEGLRRSFFSEGKWNRPRRRECVNWTNTLFHYAEAVIKGYEGYIK